MESPTTTFALLEQAKGGDEQALRAPSNGYRRRLAVLIHYKLSPQAREFSDVEDLVQETCLRAFRDIASFTYQSPGSFLRWLSAIADHAIIDRDALPESRAPGWRGDSLPLGLQSAGPGARR